MNEAVALRDAGIPVLVTRAVTERPEGLEAGAVRMVGTGRAKIRRTVGALLEDPAARERMASAGRGYSSRART